MRRRQRRSREQQRPEAAPASIPAPPLASEPVVMSAFLVMPPFVLTAQTKPDRD
jgi:hypothetical protein